MRSVVVQRGSSAMVSRRNSDVVVLVVRRGVGVGRAGAGGGDRQRTLS
jgi:hypothetical protein